MPAVLLAAALMSAQVSVTPVSRMGEAWWKERHEACQKIQSCRVAFLGDSITQGWEGGGKTAWNRDFAPLDAANFGFSGDRTEHVLWRLEQGELLPCKPKLVVMMIGTNNIGHGSSNSEQTALGVRTIVERIRKALPETKILLLGIFPRGKDSNDSMRRQVNAATEGFKGLDDQKHVFFKDISYAFTYHNGDLKTLLMPDLLHLTADGYEIWAKAILKDVQTLSQ